MHVIALAMAVVPHVVLSTTPFLGNLALPPPKTLSVDASPETRASMQARAYFSTHNAGATLRTEAVEPSARGIVVHQVQTLHGVPLDNTYATSLIRDDHLIYAQEALVRAPALSTTPAIAASTAAHAARESMLTTASLVEQVGTPKLVVATPTTVPTLVWRVPVASAEPPASWDVDIDAQQGSLVRITKSSFDAGTGEVRANIEPRCEGDAPVSVAMPHIKWNDKGYANALGEFTTGPRDRVAQVTLQSRYLDLYDAGDDYVTPGPWIYQLAAAPAHNDIDLVGASMTQTDAYYHFHTIRQWVEDNAAPSSEQAAWAKQKMTVNVNLPRHCNAYYSPFLDTLNFFSAGEGCIDTARSPIVVFHEYGHALMHHSGNSATHTIGLHEGYADVIASYASGQPSIRDIDPGCTNAMRNCANSYTYCDEGCDFSAEDEGHSSAQVLCGAWWDLRTSLAKRYGKKNGPDTATRLFLQHLALIGDDMPDTYAAAIASDDDDDGDPSNGTDHSCEINEAYASTTKHKAHFPDLSGMVPCNP